MGLKKFGVKAGSFVLSMSTEPKFWAATKQAGIMIIHAKAVRMV